MSTVSAPDPQASATRETRHPEDHDVGGLRSRRSRRAPPSRSPDVGSARTGANHPRRPRPLRQVAGLPWRRGVTFSAGRQFAWTSVECRAKRRRVRRWADRLPVNIMIVRTPWASAARLRVRRRVGSHFVSEHERPGESPSIPLDIHRHLSACQWGPCEGLPTYSAMKVSLPHRHAPVIDCPPSLRWLSSRSRASPDGGAISPAISAPLTIGRASVWVEFDLRRMPQEPAVRSRRRRTCGPNAHQARFRPGEGSGLVEGDVRAMELLECRAASDDDAVSGGAPHIPAMKATGAAMISGSMAWRTVEHLGEADGIA